MCACLQDCTVASKNLFSTRRIISKMYSSLCLTWYLVLLSEYVLLALCLCRCIFFKIEATGTVCLLFVSCVVATEIVMRTRSTALSDAKVKQCRIPYYSIAQKEKFDLLMA